MNMSKSSNWKVTEFEDKLTHFGNRNTIYYINWMWAKWVTMYTNTTKSNSRIRDITRLSRKYKISYNSRHTIANNTLRESSTTASLSTIWASRSRNLKNWIYITSILMYISSKLYPMCLCNWKIVINRTWTSQNKTNQKIIQETHKQKISSCITEPTMRNWWANCRTCTQTTQRSTNR